jgi:hypothetical protein
VGPLSTTQVRELLTAGMLRPMDRLWKKWTRQAECQLTAVAPQAALEGEASA